MGRDDYDPGSPYDPPPYRRRRQRRGEYDDAWAAADEDDYYDDGVEIEDLAAGYVDHEQEERRRGQSDDGSEDWHDGDNWSPSVNRARERGRTSRRPRYDRGGEYDRSEVYGRSRTYYRDRMRRGEYGEYHADQSNQYDAYSGKQKRSPYQSSSGPNWGRNIAYWQIVIVVILALCAVSAVVLACLTLLLV